MVCLIPLQPHSWAMKAIFLYKNMRSCGQHGHRGHDGEHGVHHQAQTVQHHSSKLPITFYCGWLLIISYFVCNNFDLLEDETQLPVERVQWPWISSLIWQITRGWSVTMFSPWEIIKQVLFYLVEQPFGIGGLTWLGIETGDTTNNFCVRSHWI